MPIPSDAYMLLSLVNTRLRDTYPSLSELCACEDVSADELTKKLAAIGYQYSEALNQFVPQ